MKRKSKPGPESPASRELIHTAIAAKAYDLWERRGRPENQTEAMWLEAERDLMAVQNWSRSETKMSVGF